MTGYFLHRLNFRRIVSATIGLGLVFVLGYWGLAAGRNYSGMCLAEKRYLSAEEKSHAFIEYSLTNLVPYRRPTGPKPFRPGPPIPENFDPRSYVKEFRTTEGFFANHPDCCEFTLASPIGQKPSWLQRLRGTVAGFVAYQVTVKHKRRDGGKPIDSHWNIWAPISNCGKIWRSLD